MTDKELLKSAAKAAGVYKKWAAPDFSVQWNGEGLWCFGMGQGEMWNPLTDDGDALRLAVKLKLNIIGNDIATITVRKGEKVFCQIQRTDDPYAATRRAIVKAAAEIGKTL